jgi:tRNA A37 methylthiotransferase MiaB
MADESQKTFYLETFGCQMNAHDSEKVVGTLVSEGYRQVPTVEEAGLVLYNTCSIRDKAEQKVFNRLSDYKKFYKQGKRFGVLGCVAQQEGEKIFDRAPYVSMVCGSASYRNLPQMPAPTRIAVTSRSLKAVTSFAPTAWSRSRAARSAAGRRSLFCRRLGRWPSWVIPRSSCWGRT